MSRRRASVLTSLLGGILMLISLGTLQADSPNQSDQEPDAVRELIVLLAAGPDAPTPEEVVDRARKGSLLPSGLGIGGPTQVRFLIPERDRHRVSAALEEENPESPEAILQRYLVFTYPVVVKLEAVQAALERNPNVLYVGENRRISLAAVIPNDPLFPSPVDPPDEHQWGSYLLRLPDAWERSKGHAWVGVIDTGIDADHPDLRAFHVSGGSTVYDGGNFRPHLSYDYGYEDNNVDEGEPQIQAGMLRNVDVAGHGTHVAGIVGATANNELGVAGACWDCSLIVSKISHLYYNHAWINAAIHEDDAAAGIYGAIERGVQILNMSFGSRPNQSPPPPDCNIESEDPYCVALDLARQRDVVIFAASGNDGSNQIDFPAKDSRVIAVGGLTPNATFWNDCATTNVECGSNYDPKQLNAPAKQVLSTFYEGIPFSPATGCDASLLPGYAGYGPCTGTSMSTPYLAGSSGLLRSINPLLSADKIEDVLLASLDNPPGWNPQYGRGKPNIASAADKVLGKAANVVLANRLTPLFSMYSSVQEDYFYTTVPQMGAAATSNHAYFSVGPDVPGYEFFPGDECQVGGFCEGPSASVYIFTTDRSPNGQPLAPLFRMTFEGTFPGGPNNPNNRDTTYTTEPAGILFFKSQGYELDGIEGYIFKKCTPEPGCMPAGTVRLYRQYNAARGDFAIFPESELAFMQGQGYTSSGGNLNTVLGYVYPNTHSDSDTMIDGFEGLIGTDPSKADSDCDGISDGTEILDYPYTDPLLANSGTGYLSKAACVAGQNVPANMVPGQSYSVSVTLRNVGTQAWSPVGPACGAYRFGSMTSTWGPTRVELPAAVASGQTVTLNFTVTAPSTRGTYSFQWSMVHECVEWFGATLNVPVTVARPKDAAVVSHNVPSNMVAGQSYSINVSLQNVGTQTWSPVGPACNAYRFGSMTSTWGPTRAELPTTVSPGQTVTLSFTVTAPGTRGTYSFEWRMVQECVGWFGDTLNVPVTVKRLKDAQVLSQSVPTTMTAGQSYAVSMTLKNVGSLSWNPIGPQCNAYRLGNATTTSWGPVRVELPAAVASDQQVALNFTVTAPAMPGTYPFRWQMVQECVEWFGDLSPNVNVNVVP